MARRRLNTKFLVLATVPIILLGAAAVAYKTIPQVKWLVRGTPAHHAAQAKILFDQGEFEKSAEEYKRAIQLKGAPDAPMFTDLSDAVSHLVLKDNENLQKTRLYLDQALIVDPQYQPALTRLLDLYEDDAEMNRGARAAQQWDAVRDAATKLLGADPHNHHAKLAQHRAVIQRWISGVETDAQRIDEAMAGLTALSQEQPFDADTVFYVLQAKLFRGQARARQNDRAGATALAAEVGKELDEALAAHPDDAMMHFRAALVLRALGYADRTAGQPPKYQDRVVAESQKAAELIKPEHPMYLEAKLSAGKQLEGIGDTAGAEKLYRQLLKDRPDEMLIRIVLSDLLGRDPARRAEAIELLEQRPPADDKKLAGFKAITWQRYEMTAVANIITLRLDSLPGIADAAERDKLLKQIDDGYARLLTAASESPVVLHIRGRIELAKGQNVQAVQTLDRALKTMSESDPEQRYKLMFTLARAYLLTDQTGEAKNLLTQIVRDFDKFVPARVMLAQLLLREQNIEEARKHLDVLAKTMPDSPVVARLSMFALDKEKDKEKLTQLYNKLPEKTREEATDKAQMAMYLQRRDEAVRLLESLRQASPNDPELLGTLAKLYADQGDKVKAVALVDEALAKNPDRAGLKMLRAQLSGADVGEVQREAIEKIDDPFRKELALFELAMQEERNDEAMAHLLAAAKLKPDDGRVQVMLFQTALGQKDWPKAEGYLASLTRLNQDMAGGLIYRVQLALAKGDLGSAADQAQQLTQKLPEFAQSWVMLGQVQQAQGKYADAIQTFTSALTRQSQNLEAIRGLIACSYALNQTADARRYIDQGRRLFPNNVQLREIDLQHEMSYGDPEKVIAPRQEILKKDPEQARAWLTLGTTYTAVARSKGNQQAAKPFLEKARDTFAQALAKWPDELRFAGLLADTCLQLRDLPSGVKAIESVRARPAWQKKPDPTLVLAGLYARAGKSADQEKLLRDYLATDPQSPAVQVELSGIVARQNKLDDALKILQPNVDVPEIRKQRIELQLNGGRVAEADKEIQSALAATPNPSFVLLNQQARVYMVSGRATEALAVLEKALAANPRNYEAMYFRGSIYVAAQRNLDQAIRDLQTVRDALPDNLDARMQLAQAFHNKGDDESAIRELEAAVHQGPNDKSARLRLVNFYARSSPPRWSQAERTLREARDIPELAQDVDLLQAEAQMWLQRKDTSKASEAILQARKLAPDNTSLFRTWCEVLVQSKEYRQLLAMTDPLVQSKKAPWWVYQYRGRAQKALDEKQKALDEFTAGIDVASAAKDDDAVAAIVKSIADEIGVEAAKARIIARAEKGENRWRLLLSYLLDSGGDLPGAVSWIEKIIADPNATPDELGTAQRVAGTLYLRLDPPETAKACAIYRKVLESSPNDPAMLNNLACAMILPNSGYTAKDALEYSQRAYNLLDQQGQANAYISDTQGYLLVLVGRVDEGISLLRQAIDKQPFAEAYYHLGEGYLALSTPLPTDAEQALKQAQTLLEQAKAEDKPVDAAMKEKIEKALERARQLAAPKPQ